MSSPVENSDFGLWEQELQTPAPADRTALVNFTRATEYFAYVIGPQRSLFPEPSEVISRKRDLLVEAGSLLAQSVYLQNPANAKEAVAELLADHDMSILKIYLASQDPDHVYPISTDLADEFTESIAIELEQSSEIDPVDVFCTAVGQVILNNALTWEKTFESRKLDM